ncbi:MAG: CoA transferase [Acidaminococcales bacterium]|nr:CoA transferase [Acidaminococcales bacterium]
MKAAAPLRGGDNGKRSDFQMIMALKNIKVLDLTKLLPGNYCGMLLADYGAEVIKVERPDAPDPLRFFQPLKAGLSYWHLTLNRGKKSLCLDFKREEGRRIFLSLARQADILLESSRPGSMARIGLDYGALREVNPRLIYCSLSGYGQTGKFSARAAHDINALGLAGINHQEGGGDPFIYNVQLAGLSAALEAAFAVLAAVCARALTGRGQAVDISLMRSALSLLPVNFANYMGEKDTGVPMYPRRAPNYCTYRTGDGGHFTVAAMEMKFWRRFCELLEVPELEKDIADVNAHPALFRRIGDIFAQKARAEWEEIFAGEDICVTPVYSLREMMEKGVLAENGMLLNLADKQLGGYRQLNCPAVLSETPGIPGARARHLGEDNCAVLESLGFSGDEIARLREKGTIAQKDPE